MKKIWIIVLVVLLSSCTKTPPVEDPDPIAIQELQGDDLLGEYVVWYGRHFVDGDAVGFQYPATGFRVHVHGSAVQFTLGLSHASDDIHFALAKDGESLLDAEVVVLTEAEQTFTVRFDTYGDHTLELVKRSEGQDGNTTLIKLATNGTFVSPPVVDTPPPHFLLIGASGISGNGAIGESWQGRTTANSSVLHSFGYLTAARFGGTFEFVSNSGWGLAFGYNDRTGEHNIQGAYEHAGIDALEGIVPIPHENGPVPDVIIVNIGGNDFSAVINRLSGFEQDAALHEFKDAVATFLLQLRQDAPDAHIYWTMTEGSMNGAAASSVIQLLSEEDKPFVHLVTIKGVGDDGTPVGANNHASYETHLLSTDILVDIIESTTGLDAFE